MSKAKVEKQSKNKISIPDLLINRAGFSEILLSMGEAVIATDKAGVITFMNKLAEKLTGWKLVESIGKPIEHVFDAINDRSMLQIQNPIKLALQNNKTIALSNHTILINKDKTERIIVDSAVPLHNSNEEIIGGALIFRDVTEQAISDKKLIESEGLIQCLMENTNLIIYIKDLEGKYLLINHQKEMVYNILAKEVIGKNTATHLTTEQAIQSRKTDLQAIKAGHLISYEQVIRHFDKSEHFYHTSKFPLYNSENQVYAVCAISTDITENKKNLEMKEKLDRNEILLKSRIPYDELMKNMPSMFFSLNSSLELTSFNAACEIFTSKKQETVIGKLVNEIFPVDTYFIGMCKMALETGKSRNFNSRFIINKNVFSFLVNIYLTEIGISVIMTDLTLQKKSEMETLELVERLQKTNKDLRLFAYTISHDLRGPITRILGLVSLFQLNPLDKINDKSILECVANEIADLDNVVADMNATISLGDDEKIKEYISFEKEFKLVKKVLENQISDSKAVFITDFHEQEGLITVKSFLYSIMYNLLSNAIKYRSPDIPLIITLKSSMKNEFICLSVKDNGVGIDMDKNGDKVFGLYNRFHMNVEGKGIGLNLVKVHAESLGGKVEVESKINKGCDFKIFFPVVHEQDNITDLKTKLN